MCVCVCVRALARAHARVSVCLQTNIAVTVCHPSITYRIGRKTSTRIFYMITGIALVSSGIFRIFEGKVTVTESPYVLLAHGIFV